MLFLGGTPFLSDIVWALYPVPVWAPIVPWGVGFLVCGREGGRGGGGSTGVGVQRAGERPHTTDTRARKQQSSSPLALPDGLLFGALETWGRLHDLLLKKALLGRHRYGGLTVARKTIVSLTGLGGGVRSFVYGGKGPDTASGLVST
jgi:hypothetical protein